MRFNPFNLFNPMTPDSIERRSRDTRPLPARRGAAAPSKAAPYEKTACHQTGRVVDFLEIIHKYKESVEEIQR